MPKYLEVGGYLLAGVLSIHLASNMYSTQERLTQIRNAELDQIEATNRAAVYAALMTPPIMEYRDGELEQIQKQIEIQEQKQVAKCFKQKQCAKLAEAIYFEDRGDQRGMQAVANVVLNRTKSEKYPNTITGVVNQKKRTKNGWVCQFSYMCQLKDRRMTDSDARFEAGLVAWKAANGVLPDITNGADHYLNPTKLKSLPRFAREFTQVAAISDHLFYRSM